MLKLMLMDIAKMYVVKSRRQTQEKIKSLADMA